MFIDVVVIYTSISTLFYGYTYVSKQLCFCKHAVLSPL